MRTFPFPFWVDSLKECHLSTFSMSIMKLFMYLPTHEAISRMSWLGSNVPIHYWTPPLYPVISDKSAILELYEWQYRVTVHLSVALFKVFCGFLCIYSYSVIPSRAWQFPLYESSIYYTTWHDAQWDCLHFLLDEDDEFLSFCNIELHKHSPKAVSCLWGCTVQWLTTKIQ